MDDLINRRALLKKRFNMYMGFCGTVPVVAVEDVDNAPTVDAVELETLKKWLYALAMNNVGQPVEDMAAACEIIISRLDGLRRFAKERREEDGT